MKKTTVQKAHAMSGLEIHIYMYVVYEYICDEVNRETEFYVVFVDAIHERSNLKVKHWNVQFRIVQKLNCTKTYI